jgi:hypothetical protein
LKKFVFAIVMGFSGLAQAAQLDAMVSCRCSQWVLGKDGEMALVAAHAGVSTEVPLSAEMTSRLVNQKFSQSSNTKLGYASVTPGHAKAMGYAASIFADGGQAAEFISQQCKKIAANDEGYANCAVSITYPINDEARRLAK